jgi:primosomal protein N' (replication factor Y)
MTPKLELFQKKILIQGYFAKHPSGFELAPFCKKLNISKKSTIIRKLESLNIINKKYIFPDKVTNKIQNQLDKDSKQCVFLINKKTPKERMSFYAEYIKINYPEKPVLIILPNVKTKNVFEDFFKKTPNFDKNFIFFGTRDSIIQSGNNFSLKIIEDVTNAEYSIEVPFYYNIEKLAIIGSHELSETIILGSYLPSLFSYNELKNGQIKHINKTEINDEKSITPQISFLDMKKEISDHGHSLIPFSIQNIIQEKIRENKKVLLFVNRKGYFNTSVCLKCGHVIRCPICGVSLSFQPSTDKLVCRYCGYSLIRPKTCPECNGGHIKLKSPGTNKIEEFCSSRFQNAPVLRIDKSVKNIPLKDIDDFSIFVGTQKVFQELDFSKIDIVIFLEIDSLLNMPFYQSQEKTLNILSKLFECMISKNESKKIIIPTFIPNNELFQCIKNFHIEDFYNSEIFTRKLFKYPPFYDLLEFSLKHKHKENLEILTNKLKRLLENIIGITIVSDKPLLGRSPFGMYQSSIIIRSKNIVSHHQELACQLDAFKKEEKVRIIIKNLE